MPPAMFVVFAVRQQLVTELQVDERQRHNRLKEEYHSLLTENVSVDIVKLARLFIASENVRTVVRNSRLAVLKFVKIRELYKKNFLNS